MISGTDTIGPKGATPAGLGVARADLDVTVQCIRPTQNSAQGSTPGYRSGVHMNTKRANQGQMLLCSVYISYLCRYAFKPISRSRS